jgi:hypothetical protein
VCFGREGVPGLDGDESPLLDHTLDQGRKGGAHHRRQHLGSVLTVLHQRVGHARKARDVHEHRRSPEFAVHSPGSVFIEDEIRHQAMHGSISLLGAFSTV